MNIGHSEECDISMELSVLASENKALKQKIKEAENCLVCAAICNPFEAVKNTLDILKSK